MRVELSKQAGKTLKKLKTSDNIIAKRIQSAIRDIQEGLKFGETLQGHSDYKKTRVGKYRIITITKGDVLTVFIIEKRETVYHTFDHFIKNQKL
jgi:mRNA-degrading endonuclease RelE of RelBE toxin-antitoxin system